MDQLKNKTNQLEARLKNNLQRIRNKAYFAITAIVVLVLLAFLGQAVAPRISSAFLQGIWIFTFICAVVFFGIGLLVFIGLKKEAAKILDILLEGSLTVIDVVDFLKEVKDTFILMLKEFINYATPVISYLMAFAIYFILLIIYKSVGRSHDVTLLTILLTVATFIIASFLNQQRDGRRPTDWLSTTKRRFQQFFADGFEVMIVLFFLTMDSTKLFLLPPKLNVPINAEIGGHNLMERAYTLNDPSRFALTIILASVFIEIVRYSLRIIAVARDYYDQEDNSQFVTRSAVIKASLRQSFAEAKDDTLKFITFTTILIAVFLVFPKLKIVAMLTASITGLILDTFIPSRLVEVRGNDLLSRIIIKVFKI